MDDLEPEEFLLAANIREFAYNVSVVCALETGGKITPADAYLRIKESWKQLHDSQKALIDNKPAAPPDL